MAAAFSAVQSATFSGRCTAGGAEFHLRRGAAAMAESALPPFALGWEDLQRWS